MSQETQRKQQTVKITSYSPKPFGWFVHMEYVNDAGKMSYAQVGFGPYPNSSSGIFPLWTSPDKPVIISCPVLELKDGTENPQLQDYTGDLLVPIPEVVIQTMFVGLSTDPRNQNTMRRA